MPRPSKASSPSTEKKPCPRIVAIDAELYADLREIAVKVGVSTAQMIRIGLRHSSKRFKNKELQVVNGELQPTGAN